MLVRIVQFLLGAAFAGGGGYLVWWKRALAPSLFPPVGEPPWLLVGGLAAAVVGVVLLGSAVMPRPQAKAKKAADAARREQQIKAADAFYSERARSADRDWRSGDLPPGAPRPQPAPQPAPAPQPVRQAAPPPPQQAPRVVTPPPQQPAPAPRPAPEPPRQAAPAPQPIPMPERPAAVKPQASATPPPSAGPQTFPSSATLSPLPRAAEPPPQAPPRAAPPPPQAPAPAAAKPAAAPASSGGSAAAFDRIRSLIADKRLDDADKILSEERDRLTAQGDSAKLALAELTGLAGDHAAAAGRSSNAKWLWRLALKRFADAEAISSPAARAVSERLRLSDQ